MAAIQERFQQALKSADRRRIKEALARGADPNLANDGAPSALYWGAQSGDPAIVAMLVEAGAKPAAEKGQSTCLHVAAGRGDVEVLRLLLKAGAKRLLNRLDEDGCTPLMRAVAAGHLEAARLLIDARADINARDDAGNTALRIAATDASLEMVKLLLSAGADPLLPGRMRLTPLDRARERKTPEGRRIAFFLTRWIDEKR
jgi:ankyrin repeat protein